MIDILQEDYRLNSFRSFLTLFFYRIMNLNYKRGNHVIVKFLKFIFNFIKIVFSLQSQISYKSDIGKSIRLPHMAFGVVISSRARIGNNVTIFHLVTIGINENKCNKKNMGICVEIGNNCYIASGAKIISANIGDNSKIGPNAVVYKDIPSNSVVLNQVEIR